MLRYTIYNRNNDPTLSIGFSVGFTCRKLLRVLRHLNGSQTIGCNNNNSNINKRKKKAKDTATLTSSCCLIVIINHFHWQVSSKTTLYDQSIDYP